MKNSYDQLQIEYLGTKKVLLFFKYTAIFIAFIPLAKLISEFNYHYIYSRIGVFYAMDYNL
ncbi:hypothetical protein DS884_00965 [Tenacibaculum sp. E3R01]|uniref:hypothetical protein n=1 Tax=Tenacibaculum sp. E3R01 TaxID=2267227 RepID=UPI000DE963E4|nr:hypothetical protein [Tenacibaculum sp. E3R01]RBW62915.1 hypothetical protein DS884_00965 [Tenacibaculum sp. E3R01]